MSEHLPASIVPKRRRRKAILAVAVIAALIAAAAFWWFGQELPSRQASAAQAAAQKPVDDEAARKKAASDEFWAKVSADNAARVEQEAKDTAAFSAAPTHDTVKPQMEAQGWTQFAGDLYYQVADKSEYTCGYLDCIVVHVTTMAANGCPGGLYVEATVDQGNATVGRANSITAALPRAKDAIVRLQDSTGSGDKMALTDIHCLRD